MGKIKWDVVCEDEEEKEEGGYNCHEKQTMGCSIGFKMRQFLFLYRA